MKLFYILVAIVMLGFIITVHEFGHYIVGRLCGIGIVEFSVGIGPKIIGFKRKGIQYSLRAIPLGGYCSFAGADEDNSAPNAMNNMPVWKRFLTVTSGPAMNFVLAFIFCVVMLCCYQIADIYPSIDTIVENTPAAESGLMPGDVIIEANGTAIEYSYAGTEAVRAAITGSDLTQPIPFTVDRDGEHLKLEILPALVVDEATGENAYQIGITFDSRTYTLAEGLKYGFRYMWETTKLMLDTLKNLFFRGEGVDDVSGPVGTISITTQLVADEKMRAVVYLIFIISLNLGIMNLLPLPALDGGRLIFLIVEALRRKPIPPEKEGMVHGLGMLLLLAAMVFFTYNDIARLFTGG